MGQFTQESFRFDLVWSQEGRIYADPRLVYDRSEAMSEHIQAAKFGWVLPEMERPVVTALLAHWKDGTVQRIAPSVMFNPDASGSHVDDDIPFRGMTPPPAPKTAQERF